MSAPLNLTEFGVLSPTQQADCVQRWVAARSEPLNGQLAELDAKIASFETRYEMSSESMCQKLSDGSLPETADICSWQILLELRGRVRQRAQ